METAEKERTERVENAVEMVRLSKEVMSDTEKGGFGKARELVERAHELAPENMYVELNYAYIYTMLAHTQKAIGALEYAVDSFKKSLDSINILRRNEYDPEGVRNLEMTICAEYGEVLYGLGEERAALKLLERADYGKYPYSVVLRLLIYLHDPSTDNAQIAEAARILDAIVGSEAWKNDSDRAMAYMMLSVLYSNGLGVSKDVDMGYYCIQKCAKLDAELAADELKKYSKGILGGVKYAE